MTVAKTTFKERIDAHARRWMQSARNWMAVRPPTATPGPLIASNDLAERQRLTELLPYTDILNDGLLVLDAVDGLRLGFILEYSPFAAAGTDAEAQAEGLLLSVASPGTVLHVGQWSSCHVMPDLDAWAQSRTQGNPAVGRLASSRRDFYLASAMGGYSLLASRSFYPKQHRYFLSLTIPYDGDQGDEMGWTEFEARVRKARATLIGGFGGMGLSAHPLDRAGVRAVLRVMLNPHLNPDDLLAEDAGLDGVDRAAALVSRESVLQITEDGLLRHRASGDPNDPRCAVTACVTVDGYPRKTYLPLTSWLTTGHPLRPQEAIAGPFYAYTNIVLKDPDKSADRFTFKLAGVTRQLVSDSPAYRAMMSHLFEQRDDLNAIIKEARDGHPVTAAYTGINLGATTEQEANTRVAECVSFWRAHGFRASPERLIGFPVWLCSLPGFFTPLHDPTEKRGGLQRSCSMTTFQAATLMPMAGEWQGTDPSNGGILLFSRRGQLAAFNVQDKRAGSNYNFAVVARSGAGKSYFAEDLLNDFLSKGGYAFVIDAGRSYYELAEQIGGQNLIFDPNDPLDLNPFTQITDEKRLNATLELLKELVRYMAFPQSLAAINGGIPDWEDAIMEHAIEASWREKREHTLMSDVADWLAEHEDPRAKDIAVQLRSYTDGRLAPWFNGTGRPIDLTSHFIVIEMDDLKSQGPFRNVVLSLMMQRIADAMYNAGDENIPKLMLIDEAWDLLSSMQAGDFIERAYRTYRKYGGSAGIITQSYADFGRSKAAEAAFINSSWLFSLAQKPESLEAAFKDGRLHGDEQLRKQLETVTTVPGHYSEVYVRCDSGAGIYRFITDPYTNWLYTTNPAEKAERTRVLNQIAEAHPDWPRERCFASALQHLAAADTAKRLGVSPADVLARHGIAPLAA